MVFPCARVAEAGVAAMLPVAMLVPDVYGVAAVVSVPDRAFRGLGATRKLTEGTCMNNGTEVEAVGGTAYDEEACPTFGTCDGSAQVASDNATCGTCNNPTHLNAGACTAGMNAWTSSNNTWQPSDFLSGYCTDTSITVAGECMPACTSDATACADGGNTWLAGTGVCTTAETLDDASNCASGTWSMTTEHVTWTANTWDGAACSDDQYTASGEPACIEKGICEYMLRDGASDLPDVHEANCGECVVENSVEGNCGTCTDDQYTTETTCTDAAGTWTSDWVDRTWTATAFCRVASTTCEDATPDSDGDCVVNVGVTPESADDCVAVCSDRSYTSADECTDSGVCSDTQYTAEGTCTASNATWTPGASWTANSWVATTTTTTTTEDTTATTTTTILTGTLDLQFSVTSDVLADALQGDIQNLVDDEFKDALKQEIAETLTSDDTTVSSDKITITSADVVLSDGRRLTENNYSLQVDYEIELNESNASEVIGKTTDGNDEYATFVSDLQDELEDNAEFGDITIESISLENTAADTEEEAAEEVPPASGGSSLRGGGSLTVAALTALLTTVGATFSSSRVF